MSHVELISILNPLSSSGRQIEEGNYRIETEKRCVLFVEIKTLNLSFNPVAPWDVTCVPNLEFAYVMHM